MSINIIMEEIFEALMRNFKELMSQNEYLKTQLAKSMSNQRKNLHGISTLVLPLVNKGVLDKEGTKGLNSLDFKVEIPEYIV